MIFQPLEMGKPSGVLNPTGQPGSPQSKVGISQPSFESVATSKLGNFETTPCRMDTHLDTKREDQRATHILFEGFPTFFLELHFLLFSPLIDILHDRVGTTNW